MRRDLAKTLVLALSLTAIPPGWTAAAQPAPPEPHPPQPVLVDHPTGTDGEVVRVRPATNDRVSLLPGTVFFNPPLHTRLVDRRPGEAEPIEQPLSGNDAFDGIGRWDRVGTSVSWFVWADEPGRAEAILHLSLTDAQAGATFQLTIAGHTETIRTTANPNGPDKRFGVRGFDIDGPGMHEARLELVDLPEGVRDAGTVRRIDLAGPPVAGVVRARWRPAAAHARLRSSAAEPADVHVAVFEQRLAPGSAACYSPITTPFGYFGFSFTPADDGRFTVRGPNFSMWGAARGQALPSPEDQPRLLAIGGGRFDGFSHEGTGVKVRGYNPLGDQTLTSVVTALRLEIEDDRLLFHGYVFDPSANQWKLFAAGSKPRTNDRNLAPWSGMFVEVPGPPHAQRTGHLVRHVMARGWALTRETDDTPATWHPLDELHHNGTADPRNAFWHASDDGYFHYGMGGLAHRVPGSGRHVQSLTYPDDLPAFLSPQHQQDLLTLPLSIDRHATRVIDEATVEIEVEISLPPGVDAVDATIYWGPTDAFTDPDAWPHRTDVEGWTQGTNTARIPLRSGNIEVRSDAWRVHLRSPDGQQAWSFNPAQMPGPD